MPGDHDDKSYLYQIPYKHMVKYMFQMPDSASFDMLYGHLKAFVLIQESFLQRACRNDTLHTLVHPNLIKIYSCSFSSINQVFLSTLVNPLVVCHELRAVQPIFLFC